MMPPVAKLRVRFDWSRGAWRQYHEDAQYDPWSGWLRRCRECSEYFIDGCNSARRCRTCSSARTLKLRKAGTIAHLLVAVAVRDGRLPRPSTLQCVDCQWQTAEVYDHRDYDKPLEVDPVCRPCNTKRGTVISLRETSTALNT